MCGIIGAALKERRAAAEVYEGLKRLEYRGYDSAGLSVLADGTITTVKRGGRVCMLQGEAATLSGRVAIGHTRWATHGEPSDENAHPHVSGNFAVVHNGIIENYKQLKDELVALGDVFKSKTDSEVIVKLIDRYYSGDLLAAVARAVKRLKGSFALAVLCSGYEGIVAVKYKSPVVIGFCADGNYVCSDVPALPACVTSVCVPEDGDIVYLTPSSVSTYDFNLNAVNRVRSPISLGQFAAGKGKYPYYMIKEIHEGARTVADTAEAFFRSADVKRLSRFVQGADSVLLTGCGTAYNAGLAAKRFFEACGVKNCRVEIASELRYNLPPVTPSTLAVAITQSGETADTVEAASALKQAGANVITVTNCGYSAITRIAHAVVPVCAGAEICVAATKSYIGQLAALYLLAGLAGDALTCREELCSLCPAIEGVLSDYASACAIATECARSSAVFFLGRGSDYDVAVEASLKLKEVSYVFSDGYPAGELKHGTLALIDKDTLSVFIICDERLADKSVNAVEQVISRRGKAAVITNLPCVADSLSGVAAVWLLPKCPPHLAPFLSAVALQLIAYRTAILLGRDPDKPRNLAKSVTVE